MNNTKDLSFITNGPAKEGPLLNKAVRAARSLYGRGSDEVKEAKAIKKANKKAFKKSTKGMSRSYKKNKKRENKEAQANLTKENTEKYNSMTTSELMAEKEKRGL